jgi:proline iminopeptidase
VSDIEVLRKHLAISKWHIVFGGSWGSTLALVYAQTHPESVGSLVVRGIFTVRRSELEWSRGLFDAAQIFPEAYEAYENHLPEGDRDKPNEGYYKLLTSDDRAIRVAAAREWNRWVLRIEELRPDPDEVKLLEDDDSVLSHASIEAHYFMHGAWLEEGQILKKENLDKIRQIPSKYLERH